MKKIVILSHQLLEKQKLNLNKIYKKIFLLNYSGIIELENKYGLIFNFRKTSAAIDKAIELLQTEGLKKEWLRKRLDVLKDKIDICSFMKWFFEEYPESLKIFRRNPDIQYSLGNF